MNAAIQKALDQLIEEKKASAAQMTTSEKDLTRDVGEFETRLLPAVVAITRIAPFIYKRLEDLSSLENYLQTAKTSESSLYGDKVWVDETRKEAMAVCCAIRKAPKLMREVQDNLVNGVPPLSEDSLVAIKNMAQSVRENKTVPNEFGDDEIKTRPFPVRSSPKPDSGLVKKREQAGSDDDDKRKGLISGVPDLQEPKPPEPPRPPAAAPIPAAPPPPLVPTPDPVSP